MTVVVVSRFPIYISNLFRISFGDPAALRSDQLKTNVPKVVSFSKASMSLKRARKIATTWPVVQFPNCSQTTLGGQPRSILKLL